MPTIGDLDLMGAAACRECMQVTPAYQWVWIFPVSHRRPWLHQLQARDDLLPQHQHQRMANHVAAMNASPQPVKGRRDKSLACAHKSSQAEQTNARHLHRKDYGDSGFKDDNVYMRTEQQKSAYASSKKVYDTTGAEQLYPICRPRRHSCTTSSAARPMMHTGPHGPLGTSTSCWYRGPMSAPRSAMTLLLTHTPWARSV